MRGRVSDYERFALLAITPAGLFDTSVAVAASRAGAVGVLDLNPSTVGEPKLSAVLGGKPHVPGAMESGV
jgi:hypothetical protein